MHAIKVNRHYLHRPACKMASLFRFSGMPDIKIFEQAIRLGMEKHELLTSKIILTADNKAFYERIDEPLVKLNFEQYEPAEGAEDEFDSMLDIAVEWVEAEDSQPLDLAKGELVHHGIFSDGRETVWAISSHYLAGDAFSWQYFARDVLSIYEQLVNIDQSKNSIKNLHIDDVTSLTSAGEIKQQPTPAVGQTADLSAQTAAGQADLFKFVPAAELDFDPEKAFKELGFVQKKQLNSYNKQWEKTGKQFGQDDYLKMYANFHKAYELKVISTSLDAESSQKLIAKSKATGLKLNSVISAALEYVTSDKESFAYPLSSRKAGNECVGIYGGSVTIPMDMRRGNSVLEIAENLNKTLSKNMSTETLLNRSNTIIANLDGGLIDSGYYAAFANYKDKSAVNVQKMFSLNKSGEGMQINNLGISPQATSYSFGELREVYYVPSIMPNFRRAVSFTTFRDQLFFTSCFYQSKGAELIILERMKTALTNFAQN